MRGLDHAGIDQQVCFLDHLLHHDAVGEPRRVHAFTGYDPGLVESLVALCEAALGFSLTTCDCRHVPARFAESHFAQSHIHPVGRPIVGMILHQAIPRDLGLGD